MSKSSRTKGSKTKTSKAVSRKTAPAPRPAKRKKIVSLAQYEAEAAVEAGSMQATPVEMPKDFPATAEGIQAALDDADRKTKPKVTKPRKVSGLDAAVTVLREAGEPLGTSEMVKRMLERGLWSTGGKTPAATIYSAILREIAVKGSEARFRKTDRGRFELTEVGKGGR